MTPDPQTGAGGLAHLLKEFRAEVKDKIAVAIAASNNPIPLMRATHIAQCEEFLVEQFAKGLASLRAAEPPEQIAREAHTGQKDKAGNDYIGHVERVAAGVDGEDARAVAWLHDVLEDTDVTCCDLARAGIPQRIIDAVKVLTRDKCDTYDTYIGLVLSAHDPLALAVKLADLNDHLTNPGCPDRLRPRYEKALARLGEATSAPAPPVETKEN